MEQTFDIDELLEKASKVSTGCEVFFVEQTDDPIHFEANRLKVIEGRQNRAVALRIIKDGNVGFASTSNLDNLDILINNAVETSNFGARADFEFPGCQSYSSTKVFDSATQDTKLEDMAELVQGAIDRLTSYENQLMCKGSVVKGVSHVKIVNSNGGKVDYKKSIFSLYIHGTIVKDDDMLFVLDGYSSCSPILETSQIEESIRRQLDCSRKIAPAPIGNNPVLFTPKGVGGVLISPLLAGFNGKALLQGSSPLVGRMGEDIVDEQFTLLDDPTPELIPGSRVSDDEGVSTKKMAMIEDGRVLNCFYDLQTSSEAGIESTGNACRNVGTLPMPGASVSIICSGTSDYQEMVRDIKDGLVVECLLGAGQSNILGGDFNANVLIGYRISNGTIIGRVKNTVISGNVYQSLKRIRSIENTCHWVGGTLKTPSMVLDGVSISTQ